MNNKIFFVYSGTQGTAGLYLSPILNCLSAIKVDCYAFTSFYYPFDNASRWFFKLTDLANGKKKKWLRPYLRYVELCWGLFRVLIKCVIIRPAFINYSLNTCYFSEYLFLLCITKILHIPIVITCHDVAPFENAYVSNDTEMKRRKIIFHLAKYLLVHNEYSKEVLTTMFHINREKIVSHRFPVMDLTIINDQVVGKSVDFLFIGHLRKEKGIDILLNAWGEFHKRFPEATLCIAGNVPANHAIDTAAYDRLNVTFYMEYMSDDEYIRLIKTARCVVLPYTKGTNSGIPSSACSVNTQVITSNLPMFMENELVDKRYVFRNGDVEDLVDKMRLMYMSHCAKRRTDDRIDSLILSDYRQAFINEVQSLYRTLIIS